MNDKPDLVWIDYGEEDEARAKVEIMMISKIVDGYARQEEEEEE